MQTMIDPEIYEDICRIEDYVSGINLLMDNLYKKGVEIRISYKDPVSGQPPSIDLWRATEHVDYLKEIRKK